MAEPSVKDRIKAVCQKIEDAECVLDKCIYPDTVDRCMDCNTEAILDIVVEAAEREMPICPPMNDREDIVVSLSNQRQACIDWLKSQLQRPKDDGTKTSQC